MRAKICRKMGIFLDAIWTLERDISLIYLKSNFSVSSMTTNFMFG
jgi:hypothetical protein